MAAAEGKAVGAGSGGDSASFLLLADTTHGTRAMVAFFKGSMACLCSYKQFSAFLEFVLQRKNDNTLLALHISCTYLTEGEEL